MERWSRLGSGKNSFANRPDEKTKELIMSLSFSLNGSVPQQVTLSFADDVPVNSQELAQAMRVSRWTVIRWREQGYQFEFGRRTTPGHLKEWLRSRSTIAQPPENKERERLNAAMGRLK